MGRKGAFKVKSRKRELNPADAYRKLLRNKEKRKKKVERKLLREEASLKKDPERIKQELDRLIHSDILGKLDAQEKKKRVKYQALWDQVSKAQENNVIEQETDQRINEEELVHTEKEFPPNIEKASDTDSSDTDYEQEDDRKGSSPVHKLTPAPTNPDPFDEPLTKIPPLPPDPPPASVLQARKSEFSISCAQETQTNPAFQNKTAMPYASVPNLYDPQPPPGPALINPPFYTHPMMMSMMPQYFPKSSYYSQIPYAQASQVIPAQTTHSQPLQMASGIEKNTIMSPKDVSKESTTSERSVTASATSLFVPTQLRTQNHTRFSSQPSEIKGSNYATLKSLSSSNAKPAAVVETPVRSLSGSKPLPAFLSRRLDAPVTTESCKLEKAFNDFLKEVEKN